MTAKQKTAPETRLNALTKALGEGTRQQIWKMLNGLHGAEIAQLLASLPPAERQIAWSLVSSENEGEVLLHVNDEVRSSLIRQMEPSELVVAVEQMDVDDLADILTDLPEVVKKQVLRSMDEQNRQRLEAVLSYPEDSAGGLMNTDTVTVRADVTLELVHRYLQLLGKLPEMTDKLIVVNRFDKYLGTLPLSTLLTSDPSLTVSEVMEHEVEPVPATASSTEVANLFEKRDLVSAPVVDENNKLLGRITIDDVVDVIRDEADHSLMSMAGLDENKDMFAPVITSAKNRGVWLGTNLITVLLAVYALGFFKDILDKEVALAILMPIPASMGGIAGTQTLTLVIRGLALGQIAKSNARWLALKEIAIAALNGIVWALLVAAIAVIGFGQWRIGLFIGLALLINLLCASVVGFMIPFGMKKFGIDPAIAGSVVVTTITDIVGYVSFLGMATLFLF